MKKGNSFIVPVTFSGLNMSHVSSIKFKFFQGAESKIIEYPGDDAILRGTNTIDLTWDEADTWKFRTDKPVRLDTLVKMDNSSQNPRTNIVDLIMYETGFTQAEVEDDE